MSDQGFHEIQLSGKQLVFLAMSAVVLAVVIFLLGVSVGKGVRSAFPPASAADLGAPGDTTVPAGPVAGTPAATKVTPNDLDYQNKLQGQSAAGAVAGAAAGAAAATAIKPAETPAATPAGSTPTTKPNLSSMANPPATEPAAGAEKPAPATPGPTAKTGASSAAPKSSPPPASSKPAESGATSKPASAEAGWVVQVDAFRNKATADDLVKQLKGKGYAAFAVPSASLFKVRVGPFADRGEADKTAGRLAKDGYKPLVTR
ncbi:MAG TPA: SPOR domain-containing protein [Vicinamibacterales bacterium]|nr:SPOR domain-containing protein [Vicinamibacterales bacterium]